VLPVRVDYFVYVIEAVVLEEQLRGEGFLPNRFRFLVLALLRLAAEKLVSGARNGSSPILGQVSSQNRLKDGAPDTHPTPIRLTKACEKSYSHPSFIFRSLK
jgi:hypothetical protein